jgi:hypothetical protein
MMTWFLRRWIAKFERTWNYDAGYLRDVLDADPRALMAFSKTAAIGTTTRMCRPRPIVRPALSAPCPRIAGPAPSW